MRILESASKRTPQEMNEEWAWLLDQLKLTPDHFLAVLQAVKEERWRKAKNPRAYIKTVAKRQAVKMGLLENRRSFTHIDDRELERAMYVRDASEATKGEDGIWRRGDGVGEFNERDMYLSYRDLLMSGIPTSLRTTRQPSRETRRLVDRINSQTDEFHIHLHPIHTPDWRKWSKAAGLDKWENLVLECRCEGKSRDQALREQPSEVARRALQSAWRRFDRTGLKRLREVAKKMFPEDVPE